MNKTLIGSLAAIPFAIAGGFSFAGSAEAASLRLTSDGTTVTTNDGDVTGIAGSTGYIGSVGNILLDITTGISKPSVGSVSLPGFNLNSQNVNINAPAATLKVELTETGFSSTADALDWVLALSGDAAQGSADVKYSLYADSSNTAFGTATTLLDPTSAYKTNYSDELYGTFDSALLDGTDFSVTLVMEIDQAANSNTNIGATLTTSVPEPAAFMGLGVVGAALAVIGRRQKSVKS
ncbi:MAG: hypothetical protein QNJ65_18960 [Xenococcaceae cyanobacterium MO_234.B1]|nr:hypothetical protein [Xenococcaceae cyanobacterium MO_234.B1]